MDQKTADLIASALQPLPGFVTIVDVALLLFVLFFFSSTVASHILEAFVGLINSRGNQLYGRLRAALGANVADEIYDSPLIKSLVGDVRGISTTLLQMLYLGLGRLGLTTSQYRGGLPAYIEPDFFARAVVALYDDGTKQTGNCPVFKHLRQEAGPDDALFQGKLVEWYKALNDRQNGVYTRWSFWRLLLIGLVLAVCMDLDTVHIVGSLWADPAFTAKLVAELPPSPPPASPADQRARGDLEAAAANVWKELSAKAAQPPLYAWQGRPASSTDWVAKLLGWLLAAFATSLGAQFWFNLLSEALKLRATGPKPAGGDTDGEPREQGS